jgi:mannose PTS system EIIA component
MLRVRISSMIGILLITHGSYGEALVQNACHVLNKRPAQLNQLGVAAQDDPLDLLPLARQMLSVVDDGQGVLILTDIFGASPSNLSLKLLKPGRVEGISGVNLPMLLRALTYREKGMEVLLTRAIAGGRDGVINMLDH